ncbi:MAG: hypothetical protein GXY55_21565 [Phycisphaerae bacterium]|mgnify:CR=1|nr:hypothetical protein [Phycisphaerae bacterium]
MNENLDWVKKVEEDFGYLKKVAGEDAQVGAMLFLAVKIGGLEHQLAEIAKRLNAEGHGQ